MYQDRERSRLYGCYTGAKWADLDRYDLTVNSGLLGTEGTVELLSEFLAGLDETFNLDPFAI